jgi:formylglycine-generating enzyme required for sulfatase activity
VVGHTLGGKSPFGVHDLAGNVWEWCLNAWADSYVEIQADAVDPCHHDDTRGGARVVRGGSWINPAGYLRSAYRFRYLPQEHGLNLGFRVLCGGSRQSDAS